MKRLSFLLLAVFYFPTFVFAVALDTDSIVSTIALAGTAGAVVAVAIVSTVILFKLIRSFSTDSSRYYRHRR